MPSNDLLLPAPTSLSDITEQVGSTYRGALKDPLSPRMDAMLHNGLFATLAKTDAIAISLRLRAIALEEGAKARNSK